MITDITLQNFKCFREVSISPKLVTVLIGPNGTGKSGLLQSLLLQKQWGGSGDPRTLELDGNLVQMSPGEFINFSGSEPPREVEFAWSGRWVLEREAHGIEVRFNLICKFDTAARMTFKNVDANCMFHGDPVHIFGSTNDGPISLVFQGERTSLSQIAGPQIAHLSGLEYIPVDIKDVLPQVLNSPRSLFAQMKLVPAVRGLGRRRYSLGSELHDDILVTDGLSAQEDAMVTTMAYSGAEMTLVSDWMRRVTGVGIKAPVVPPQSVAPVSTTSFGEPSLLAEGSGTNALVHLLFELARARSGATVLIEEPEIHLHPGAQAELASVIAGEAKASNKQVIMTTHSEHIAGRLMIEVAEGNLSPEDIAIYSFEKDDDGVCSASEIEVSENGQVAGGLRSFFQTDLDEMRRYVDALRAKA